MKRKKTTKEIAEAIIRQDKINAKKYKGAEAAIIFPMLFPLLFLEFAEPGSFYSHPIFFTGVAIAIFFTIHLWRSSIDEFLLLSAGRAALNALQFSVFIFVYYFLYIFQYINFFSLTWSMYFIWIVFLLSFWHYTE